MAVPLWLLFLAVAYAAAPSVVAGSYGAFCWLRHVRQISKRVDPSRLDVKAYVRRKAYYDNEIWLRYIDVYLDDVQNSMADRVLALAGIDAWIWMWPLWLGARLRSIHRTFDRKVPPDFRPTRRQPAGRRTWNYGDPT